MVTTNINIRTDSELKKKAQSVLADLGLDLTTAINVYLNQIVYRQAIPFEISRHVAKTAKLGGWEGKVSMSADFNAPMEEFRDYMK
jgi:DNA-damage-inducible protein J